MRRLSLSRTCGKTVVAFFTLMPHTPASRKVRHWFRDRVNSAPRVVRVPSPGNFPQPLASR